MERTFVHRILRYVPNLLRDESVNIGVLLYDPNTGEHRLRLIEEEAEFNRLNCLHPGVDEHIPARAARSPGEPHRRGCALNGNGRPGPQQPSNGQGNPEA